MIQFYKSENSNYELNGDISLQIIEGKFVMELNGICEINITIPYDNLSKWKMITKDGVIKAPTPYSQGQLFSIYDIKKDMSGLNIQARHIFFDLRKKICLDIRAVSTTAEEALNKLLEGTKFRGHSNLSTVSTCYFERVNKIAAINGDKDNTLLNRWGGEIFLDNFDIYINDRVGREEGPRIRYSVNMLNVELSENWDGVITRAYPIAYDGVMLPEKYIDSNLIGNYRDIYENYVEMSDLKLKNNSEDEEGFETEEELFNAMRSRIKELYKNGLDKPTISGETDFAILNNYEKDALNELNKVMLGDTVTIEHEEIGIDLKARCIAIEWNMLTKEIKSTIGEFQRNIFNEASKNNSIIDKITNPNGSINPNSMEGVINALQVQFKALKDIAQKQHIRAMLFEDRDPESPTFGCMCLGTMGFEIASEFKQGTKEWDFRTFGTGKGFFADCIIAGILKTVILESINGNFRLDLSTDGAAKFFNDGELALSISNNQIQLYNWKKNNDFIGSLAALVQNNDANQPLIGLYNDKDSATMIGYQGSGDNSVPAYVYFDKYDVLKFKELFGKKYPIQFLEDAFFNSVGINKIVTNSIGFNSQNDSSIYESTSKHLILNRNTHCTGNITASNIPRMANDRIENIELKLMQEEGII